MDIKPQPQDAIIFQFQNDIPFLQRRINGNFACQDQCFKLCHVHPEDILRGKAAESLDETGCGFYKLTDLSKRPEPDFRNFEVRTILYLFGFAQYKPSPLSFKEIVFVKDRRRDPEPFQQIG